MFEAESVGIGWYYSDVRTTKYSSHSPASLPVETVKSPASLAGGGRLPRTDDMKIERLLLLQGAAARVLHLWIWSTVD